MSVAVIDRNDVFLSGRLSDVPELKSLPSGDPLVSFRLVVRRPQPVARSRSTDTLLCVAYDRALQRRITLWQPGDMVEVEGALQRRFWRTSSGTASVTEVNCRRGRKVSRSATADGQTA